MKKVTTKIIPAKKKQEITKTVYYCDICSEIIGEFIYRKNQCAICAREIHDNFKCGDEKPDEWGDYPDYLCRICLDLYNTLMLPLQQRHEAEEKDMLARIKSQSIAEDKIYEKH